MLANKPRVIHTNLAHAALENDTIDAHVHLYKSHGVKIDVMAVTQGVPAEVHGHETQMIHVVEGTGYVVTGDCLQNKTRVIPGSVVIIPPGTRHKIVNSETRVLLRFFTVYCHD
jgi:mannose-6-phosphate isomerase-like protein (cupin superfamily)